MRHKHGRRNARSRQDNTAAAMVEGMNPMNWPSIAGSAVSHYLDGVEKPTAITGGNPTGQKRGSQ